MMAVILIGVAAVASLLGLVLVFWRGTKPKPKKSIEGLDGLLKTAKVVPGCRCALCERLRELGHGEESA
jgi:hypothetical protein